MGCVSYQLLVYVTRCKHYIHDNLSLSFFTHTFPLSLPAVNFILQVCADQMLYAMNGKLICLGHVEPDQVHIPQTCVYVLAKC